MNKPETVKSRQKTASRKRIVSSAGQLIRRRGLAAPSVNDVMSGAGLTVGGFYAHFPSKDALMADAMLDATDATIAALFAGRPDGEPVDTRVAVARYLSAEHRDSAGPGCPLPSVASEARRVSPKVRLAVGAAVEHLAAALAAHAGADECTEEKSLALVALLVGGMTLSRSVRSPTSDLLLRACQNAAEELLPSPKPARTGRRKP